MVLGHDRVLVRVSGRVIEVGVGNGLNFAHYPDSVTDVLAVESEDRLRARAEKAAGRARVPVRVVAGHAGALPAEDGEFDAAVAALVLCSVGDVDAALAEIRRVLRQLAGAAKGNPAACTAARRAQIIFVSCRS